MNLFHASPLAPGGLLAISEVPWLGEASLRSLLSSSHGVFSCVYICIQISSFLRTPVVSDHGTTLLQECLILGNCFCKDLISKQGHILRYFNIWTWGKGMGGSGEHTIQPTMVNVLGYGPYCLCCNYSTLPVRCKRRPRSCVDQGVWLCCNKTFFTDPGI